MVISAEKSSLSPAIMSYAVLAQVSVLAYGEPGWVTDPDENNLPLVGCFSVITSTVWFSVHLYKCVFPLKQGKKWGDCLFVWFGLFAIALTKVQVRLLLCRSFLRF